MHDWYSHSYFTDDLPLRRDPEDIFHTLAELKTSTGSVVQPFLSHIRTRNFPPNLPIPLAALHKASIGSPSLSGTVDHLQHLELQSPAPPTSYNDPEHPPQASSHNMHGYMPERYLQRSQQNFHTPQTTMNHQLPYPAPSYNPSSGPGWGPTASRNVSSRLNTEFGSVGMPSPIGSASFLHQQAHTLYSPIIGGPTHRNAQTSLFSPTVGLGTMPQSPWGISLQPQSMSVQQPQPLPRQQEQSPLPAWQSDLLQSRELPISLDPSHQEQWYGSTEALSPQQGVAVESMPLPETEEPAENGEEELGSSVSEARIETPLHDVTPPSQTPEPPLLAKTAAHVQSAWGPKPSPTSKTPIGLTSRKMSLVAPASAQLPPPPTPSSITPITKLPPAPASLPPKPMTLTKSSASENGKSVGPQTPEKILVSIKPAPWALAKDEQETRTSPAGPSLREIQEVEARQVEARRQAIVEARTASGSPAQTTGPDELPHNLTWGLPPQGQRSSAVAPLAAASSPVLPVWGGGEAGPKKTLKQIQVEEEKRKLSVAVQARETQAAAGLSAGSKRGYADLAANTSVCEAFL